MQAVKKKAFRTENLTVVTNSLEDFLSGKRVLLVGANEVDEMLLRYMIVEHGGTLNVVTNEAAMRRTCSSSRYDLILMNSRLDNENSIGILKRLKEESLIKAPVVAISSGDPMVRAQGFAHTIHRPVEKRKVLSALSSVLNQN